MILIMEPYISNVPPPSMNVCITRPLAYTQDCFLVPSKKMLELLKEGSWRNLLESIVDLTDMLGILLTDDTENNVRVFFLSNRSKA